MTHTFTRDAAAGSAAKASSRVTGEVGLVSNATSRVAVEVGLVTNATFRVAGEVGLVDDKTLGRVEVCLGALTSLAMSARSSSSE